MDGGGVAKTLCGLRVPAWHTGWTRKTKTLRGLRVPAWLHDGFKVKSVTARAMQSARILRPSATSPAHARVAGLTCRFSAPACLSARRAVALFRLCAPCRRPRPPSACPLCRPTVAREAATSSLRPAMSPCFRCCASAAPGMFPSFSCRIAPPLSGQLWPIRSPIPPRWYFLWPVRKDVKMKQQNMMWSRCVCVRGKASHQAETPHDPLFPPLQIVRQTWG